MLFMRACHSVVMLQNTQGLQKLVLLGELVRFILLGALTHRADELCRLCKVTVVGGSYLEIRLRCIVARPERILAPVVIILPEVALILTELNVLLAGITVDAVKVLLNRGEL